MTHAHSMRRWPRLATVLLALASGCASGPPLWDATASAHDPSRLALPTASPDGGPAVAVARMHGGGDRALRAKLLAALPDAGAVAGLAGVQALDVGVAIPVDADRPVFVQEAARAQARELARATGAIAVIWGRRTKAGIDLAVTFAHAQRPRMNMRMLLDEGPSDPGDAPDTAPLPVRWPVLQAALPVLFASERGRSQTRLPTGRASPLPAHASPTHALMSLQKSLSSGTWHVDGRDDISTARAYLLLGHGYRWRSPSSYFNGAMQAYEAGLRSRAKGRGSALWLALQAGLGRARRGRGTERIADYRSHREKVLMTVHRAYTQLRQAKAHSEWLERDAANQSPPLKLADDPVRQRALARVRSAEGDVLRAEDQRENLQRTADDVRSHLRASESAYLAALAYFEGDRQSMERAHLAHGLARTLVVQARFEGTTKPLERAVALFREALTVRTRARDPAGWAATQRRQGDALQLLGARTGQATWHNRALDAYQAALTVHTTRSRIWAWLRYRVGKVTRALAQGEASPMRMAAAIAGYRDALTVYTPERASRHRHGALVGLGLALQWLAGQKMDGELSRAAWHALRDARNSSGSASVESQAHMHELLGDVQVQLGRHTGKLTHLSRAIEAYRRALRDYQQLGPSAALERTRNALEAALFEQAKRQAEREAARVRSAQPRR